MRLLFFARLLLVTLVALLLVATPAIAFTETLEEPPLGDPAALLGDRIKGPNYTVEEPVRSDGYMRIYTLRTHYGRYVVAGDGLLALRLRELGALHKLEGLDKSKRFTDALKQTAMRPMEFVEGTIKDPVGTMERTVSGVGRLFGRIGSGISNMGKSPDNAIAGISGQSRARRELAVELGVDPYTDFQPLSEKLDEVAMVATVGGLGVRGAMMLIPGGIGLAISGAGTATDLTNLIRDKTPAELLDYNRQRMFSMGFGGSTAEALLSNRNFTPAEATLLVAGFEKLNGVEAREFLLARMATALSRDVAIFQLRRMALLVDHHRNTAPIRAFVDSASLPLMQMQDGSVIALFPLDQLAWNEPVANAFGAITDDLVKYNLLDHTELRITGQATEKTREILQRLGWQVTENVPEPRPARK